MILHSRSSGVGTTAALEQVYEEFLLQLEEEVTEKGEELLEDGEVSEDDQETDQTPEP